MNRAPDVNALLANLLDSGYTDVAGRVIASIARNATSGVLDTRLTQFEAEAKRLDDLGQKMTPDNPVFRALVADLNDVLTKNTGLLEHIAPDLQTSGADAGSTIARELALPGLSDGQLSGIGVPWNRVDPEALARLVDFSSRDSWRALLDGYKSGIADAVEQLFLRGLIEGRNPLAIARDLRGLIEGLTVSQANTLARTLQLNSYRAATAANYAANSDILEPEGIRIETLDARICVSCVYLHGTPAPIDTPCDEHWNGRGVVVPVLKGNSIDIQTGEDWFNNLPDNTQTDLMGPAAYAAWRAGDVQLSDFVERHNDDTFGGMIHEASLKGILGKKARKYYAA